MCAKLSDLIPLLGNKEKDSSKNLRDTLSKYLYHWPLFVIGVLVTVTAAFFYLQFADPIYEIKATLLVKDVMKKPEEKTALDELNIVYPSKLAESEIEVLKSRDLIFKVVKDLQLWASYYITNGLKKKDLYKDNPVRFILLDSINYYGKQLFKVKIKDANSFFLIKSNGEQKEFRFNVALENSFGKWCLEPTPDIKKFIGKELIISIQDPNMVAQDYQKNIDAVLLNKLAPAIGLSLKDNIQQRGKDIINDLIIRYNGNDMSAKNKITQNTLNFITARIGSIAEDLNNSEQDLEKYRSSNGVNDISQQSQAYLDNMHDNDNRLNDVNVQLNMIENIEKNINFTSNLQSASAALGSNYPSLNSLIEKLSVLQLQRDKLLGSTPESNPAFEPINLQIKTTKANIKDNIENIKTSLLVAKNKLESVNSGFETSIKSLPMQERELVDKTRQKNIKENLYTYLLQKREEISMSYASTIPDTQIVDYAYSNSFSSQKSLIYGASILLGLLLPLGFINARNGFNNRITKSSEIEDVIGARLFGELTHARHSSTLVADDKNNFEVGEEFRALRTNLYFLVGKQDHGTVLLLTSSIANEGKSFVSSNLGVVLASSGKKTVIIEMDLRRPKISAIFDLTPNPGITDYLAGNLLKEEIVKNSNIHKYLDIISSGQLPGRPSELLVQEHLDSLINWLKESYDYILIDSPPINLVTDARVLSRFSDITLYIVRQNVTYKSLLPFIRSLVNEKKLPEMKFIFNDVMKGKYGYGYNYGNEYYQAISRKENGSIRGSRVKDFFRRF